MSKKKIIIEMNVEDFEKTKTAIQDAQYLLTHLQKMVWHGYMVITDYCDKDYATQVAFFETLARSLDLSESRQWEGLENAELLLREKSST